MKRRHPNINNEILMEKRVMTMALHCCVLTPHTVLVWNAGVVQAGPPWRGYFVRYFPGHGHPLLPDGVRCGAGPVVADAGEQPRGRGAGPGGLPLVAGALLLRRGLECSGAHAPPRHSTQRHQTGKHDDHS